MEFSARRENFSLILVKALSLDTGSTPLLTQPRRARQRLTQRVGFSIFQKTNFRSS